MKDKPTELNSDTPQWFKDWRNQEFWHFKFRVERKLSLQCKLIWIVLGSIIAGAIAQVIF